MLQDVHVTLPSEIGLRRVPRQARSRARVDTIITALVDLVGAVDDPGALTTADVAARAGVPLGSLYEYFEDLGSIVDAAVARMLDRHDELLADVTADVAPDTDQLTDQLFDHYLVLYREQPEFVSLRNSVLFEPRHREWLSERVAAFVRRIVDVATENGVLPAAPDTAERLDLVFVIGDALVQEARRKDARDAQHTIDEGRMILRYAVDRIARGVGLEAE